MHPDGYLAGHRLDPDSALLRAMVTSSPPTHLDSNGLAADLDFFREILERYCIGYDRLLRHPDYDPERFFADWRHRVVDAGTTIERRAALVPELTALQGFAPNSHLMIVGTGPAGRRPSPYRYDVVDDTALISIGAFRDLDAFVADYPHHTAYPRIVFDLRGNTGGNLNYLMRWLAEAKPTPWQSYGYDELVAPCLRWNQVVIAQIRAGTVDTPAAARERAELPTDGGAGMRRFDGVRDGHGSTPYLGRVVALVDRHTGSSGEKAAIELQRGLGATLMGEPTAGAMQYTETVHFVLPRTGLVMTVPTKRADYGAEVEGIGWPVDVPLDPIDLAAADIVRTRLD